MKKNKLICILLFMAFIFSTNVSAQGNENQQECTIPTMKTSMSAEKDMWDIIRYFETSSSNQGGVATDGEYIYTSSFSTEMFYKFEMDGTFIEAFTIPGVDKIGCLTYDGNYFYGANGLMDRGIDILDLENKLSIGNITVNAPSIIALGHISWDPTLDDGNGGFWTGYWAELCAVDKQGNEIVPNVVIGNPGISGTALDTVTDPDNPSLICFQRTGDSKMELTRYDINSSVFSDVLHVATDIPGPSGGSQNSVSSGLNTFINDDGKLVLLGMIDCFPGHEMIFEYEISNAINYTTDVSVKNLIAPETGDGLTDANDITVELVNNGTATISNFEVQYTINDGTGALGPFVQTVTSSMSPGQNIYFTFDETADMSMPGVAYTIIVTSSLEGDENPANDELTKVITNTSGNYCEASGGSSSSQEYISNINISGVSNSSGADHYADYTGDPDLTIYLDPDASSNLVISIANGYNADLAAVWIDWNDNGDFYDSGDEVFVSDWGPGPYQTNINVPGNALQGVPLRMRIRLDYNATPDPCGSSSFGEVEDYTVVVSAVQLNPPLDLQFEFVDDDVKLMWEAPSSKDLQGYNIYYSENMGDFSVIADVDMDVLEYLTAKPDQGIHRYYVTAVYDDGESIPSNIVEFVLVGVTDEAYADIELFPNPASDFITINSSKEIEEIELFDFTGKRLRKLSIKNKSAQVNVSDINSGVYLLKLMTSKGITYHRIIIE